MHLAHRRWGVCWRLIMSTGKEIVIVASYCLGEEPVIRNRIKAFIDVLAGQGWSITVVAPPPKTELGRSLDCELACSFSYVEQRRYSRTNFVVRGLNEMWYSWRLATRARKIGASLTIVTVPSIFLLFSRWRPHGRALVAIDIRDIVWEYLPGTKLLTAVSRSVLRSAVLRKLRAADLITVSNPAELTYLARLGTAAPPLLVSNGISRQQFETLQSISRVAGDGNVIRITYVGNVGLAQNLSTLVAAVAGQQRYELTIIGSGNDLERVHHAVQRSRAGNIRLIGRLRWEYAVQWYGCSDVVYTQLQASYVTAVPSKLYEYLATGLPIIYGGCGAAAEMLKEFSGVTVITSDNPAELANALSRVEPMSPGRLCWNNIQRVQEKYIREDGVVRFEAVAARMIGNDVVPCSSTAGPAARPQKETLP